MPRLALPSGRLWGLTSRSLLFTRRFVRTIDKPPTTETSSDYRALAPVHGTWHMDHVYRANLPENIENLNLKFYLLRILTILLVLLRFTGCSTRNFTKTYVQ